MLRKLTSLKLPSLLFIASYADCFSFCVSCGLSASREVQGESESCCRVVDIPSGASWGRGRHLSGAPANDERIKEES